ncbi:MAG: SAF domain-containing protein [Propionibacteriaceae bacterium]|nr:SAF domain-containing protein [Propionibacteriaceae bacterium]
MKNLLTRIASWVSWHRRLAGSALAALAVLMVGAALANPDEPTSPAVVAAHPLPAGHIVTEADVRLAHLPPIALPEEAITDVAEVAGRSTAVAVAGGTILQPPLLATSHSTDPGRALVPIALRDAGLRALLKPGDQVTLVTTGYDEVTVLTADARVAVLATPPGSSPLSMPSADQGALILMDVPVAEAPLVAALGQEGGLRIVLGAL